MKILKKSVQKTLVLASLISVNSWSQSIYLTGKVIDTDNQVIPMATTQLIKANISSLTNDAGIYTLQQATSINTNILSQQSLSFSKGIIQLNLSAPQPVLIKLQNILGQEKIVFNQSLSEGQYALKPFEMPTESFANGMYFVHIQIGFDESTYSVLKTQSEGSQYLSQFLGKTTAQALDTLVVSKTGFTSTKFPINNYNSGTLNDIILTPLCTTYPQWNANITYPTVSNTTNDYIYNNSNGAMIYYNNVIWSTWWAPAGKTPGADNSWVQHGACHGGSLSSSSSSIGLSSSTPISSSVTPSSSKPVSSSLAPSSSTPISSSIAPSSSKPISSSIAPSSSKPISSSIAPSSSTPVSSSAITSSASTCTRTAVAGYYFDVATNSATMNGYQANSYTAFSAGDKVVPAGASCALAVTLAAEPVAGSYNLAALSAWTGSNYINTTLEKVSGNLSGTSSSNISLSSTTTLSSSSTTTSSASGSNLNQLITLTQWNQMFPNRSASTCAADGASSVYTYDNFISAASSYPEFAQYGTDEIRKREIAAFLGNIAHETTGGWVGAPGGTTAWGLCFTEEVGCNDGTCTQYNDYGNSTYPVVAGHSYHGRGPLQLSWNYNYGYASQQIFGDKMYLLNNPDLVKTNGVVAFKTAIWFWMTTQSPKPSAHDVIAKNVSAVGYGPSGFGLTINIINGGIECGSGSIGSKQQDRIDFYNAFATKLGTTTGSNLDCANQTHF